MAEVQSNVSYGELEGFLGYQIGDDGSIRSFRVQGGGEAGKLKRKPRLMKQKLTKNGYLEVTLSRSDRLGQVTLRVNRLVLEAFKGKCPEGMEGCHKNGIKTDNRLKNLYWGTKQENMEDREAHGKTARGERSGMAVLDEDKVRWIREKRSQGYTQKWIARKLNVGSSTVHNVLVGNTWSHVDHFLH